MLRNYQNVCFGVTLSLSLSFRLIIGVMIWMIPLTSTFVKSEARELLSICFRTRPWDIIFKKKVGWYILSQYSTHKHGFELDSCRASYKFSHYSTQEHYLEKSNWVTLQCNRNKGTPFTCPYKVTSLQCPLRFILSLY